MLRILVDFGRLILLILFLPLFILLIGPLLILAVLRGRQPAGPVVLNTSRYGLAGRLGAFLVGLLLWAVTWGGLAWVVMTAAAQWPNVAGIQFLWPPVAAPVPILTLTPSPVLVSPTLSAAPVTLTPSSVPATATPAVPSATPTPALPSPTLVQLQDPVSPTPDQPGPSPTPPATPTFTATPAAAPTRLAAGTTVSPAAAAVEAEPTLNAGEAAVVAVTQGNLLLQAAIISSTPENLQNLETIWRGQALRVTQAFVDEVNGRYTRPLTVDFDYISPPTLTGQSGSITATVITRENWHYSAPNAIKDESFEFTYSVTQEDGRWVITGYTFRNLATPTATAAPASPTPAVTVTPTVSG